MSLAAIEGMREGTLYLSTGGGWSPATEAAIRALAVRPGAQFVGATDANSQGQAFATRMREIAEVTDCDWLRLTPSTDDWNEVLQTTVMEGRDRRRGRKPGCRMPAVRVKGEASPGCAGP